MYNLPNSSDDRPPLARAMSARVRGAGGLLLGDAGAEHHRSRTIFVTAMVES
jgi:hypothetical protein